MLCRLMFKIHTNFIIFLYESLKWIQKHTAQYIPCIGSWYFQQPLTVSVKAILLSVMFSLRKEHSVFLVGYIFTC